MDLERLVKERLNVRANCSGHCQEPYELKILPQEEMMIGCYTCPSGYVSLMVHYGKQLDLNAFKTFLSSLLEDKVADEDVRVATRYNWDLGIEGEPKGTVLREAYWRQSYRRTKSDDPHRVALFQCTKCSSFYRQQISDKNRLCPRCGRPTA
jgi:hypothetical protein